MLERLFGSKTRARLLGWFFTHPDEKFFVRQLAAILKEDATHLSREMANLEKLGVLISGRERNLKLFQVNRRSSFYNEMEGLILKTIGVGDIIKEPLARLTGIEFALIHGSYARGQQSAASVVELLVVGSVDMDILDRALAAAERASGREIDCVTYGKREFLSKKRRKDGFLSKVLSQTVTMLIGREDQFKDSPVIAR
jgi:predicted nucleotidyltransferase